MKITALLLVTMAWIGGCAASPQTLTIQRDHSDQRFTASFDRAFFSQAIDGQLDVILLSDGPADAAIDRPLLTATNRPVRQLVHLRILWQQPRDLRIDNPSANNAIINWHVIASPSDRLTYAGAAWARVSLDEQTADLDLRSANIVIHRVTGKMDDPLKRATLSGKLTAQRSDSAVRSYLDELTTLENPANPSAMSGPPSRNMPFP